MIVFVWYQYRKTSAHKLPHSIASLWATLNFEKNETKETNVAIV